MDGCLQVSIWVSRKEALLHLWETRVESDVHHEHVGQARNRVSQGCHMGGRARNQNSWRIKP